MRMREIDREEKEGAGKAGAGGGCSFLRVPRRVLAVYIFKRLLFDG
jgi:hypothetical protein